MPMLVAVAVIPRVIVPLPAPARDLRLVGTLLVALMGDGRMGLHQREVRNEQYFASPFDLPRDYVPERCDQSVAAAELFWLACLKHDASERTRATIGKVKART